MFTHFYYTIKSKGIDVSLSEWLSFIEALNNHLSGCTLTSFYYMSRAILVKKETDFDKGYII